MIRCKNYVNINFIAVPNTYGFVIGGVSGDNWGLVEECVNYGNIYGYRRNGNHFTLRRCCWI